MHKDKIYFKTWVNKALVFILLMVFAHLSFSQPTDSTKTISQFSGKVFLTQNGISLIPSFSLNKPALLFNLTIGNERLTFEPDIRFSLEGKPWTFIFWWRYKAIHNDKFSLRVGTHPALNFRTIPVVSNGTTKEVIETRRFLAGEIAPTFSVTKNFAVGPYYLYARGLDDSQKNTHFVVLNTAFSNLNLSKTIHLSVFPNVYYLKMDERDGFYVSSSFRIAKKGFPISLESIVNKIIESEISPEQDFVWNVSLVYSFNKRYTQLEPSTLPR